MRKTGERGAVRHTADHSTTSSAIPHLNCLPPSGEDVCVCGARGSAKRETFSLLPVCFLTAGKNEERERDTVDQRLSLSLLIDFYESEYFSFALYLAEGRICWESPSFIDFG